MEVLNKNVDSSLTSNYNVDMKTDNLISLISIIRERAHKLLIREMEKRNIKGLVTSHGDILAALFKEQVLTMKDIANKIEKDKSTVTALINKLVHIGYVKKEEDLLDKRVILIVLTEKGQELQADFEEISEKLLSVVYAGISVNERAMLVEILNKIKDNF